MSQKTWYDADTNTFHFTPDAAKAPVVPEQKAKKELRGFIVTIAHTQEDIVAIQEGDHTKMQLAPVMAPEEQDAINLISQQGKIPLSIVSYEYLKFQTGLLEELAQQEDITLLTHHVFKAQDVSQ